MIKVNDLNDMIDLIVALESENILVETEKDLNRIKDLCKSLACSQGFYGRLLENLKEVTAEDLPIIL